MSSRFGRHLYLLLERAGGPSRYGQNELARAIGVSHSYISRLLLGQRQPSRRVVDRLADVLTHNGAERDALFFSAGYAPTEWSTATLADLARIAYVGRLLLAPTTSERFRGSLSTYLGPWGLREGGTDHE